MKLNYWRSVMGKIKAKSELNIDKPEQPYVENSEQTFQENSKEEWDYLQDNLGNLYNDILRSINLQEPIFLFSKENQVHRISLNVEKQKLILEQIKGLKEISEAWMDIKVQEIFSPEYWKYLLLDKVESAKELFNIKREERLTIINAEQAKRKDIALIHREKEVLIKGLELANDLISEEIKEKKIKTELIENLKNSIDFKNLSETYQSALIATYLNANASELNKLDMQAGLKNALEQQAQAEADKKKAEAERAKSENKAFDWKIERDKKAVEKNDKL